jgi:hypothetical protein
MTAAAGVVGKVKHAVTGPRLTRASRGVGRRAPRAAPAVLAASARHLLARPVVPE